MLCKSALALDFLDDSVQTDVVPQDPEDVADVHADAFVVVGGVGDVGGEGFLVAVEGEADDFAAGVKHGGAGVTAGYIVVREEVDGAVVAVQGCDEVGRERVIVLRGVVFLAEAAGR